MAIEIAEKEIQLLLESTYGEVRNFTKLPGGQHALVFSFLAQSKEYVIRINTLKDGFVKDDFAYQNFSSEDVPIPKIEKIGELANGEELFFCVSERVYGERYRNLSEADQQRFFPEVVRLHRALHEIKPVGPGFGDVDFDGRALDRGWKAFLLDKKNEVYWDELEGRSIFRAAFAKECFENFSRNFLQHLPENRNLLHGDLSFDNILIANGKITGLIDWSECKYGDSLYDLAWLSLSTETFDCVSAYEELHPGIPSFHTRVAAYQLWIIIASLEFFAETEQEEKYYSLEARAKRLFPELAKSD